MKIHCPDCGFNAYYYTKKYGHGVRKCAKCHCVYDRIGLIVHGDTYNFGVFNLFWVEYSKSLFELAQEMPCPIYL